jgi:hypothetical protein
MGQDMSNVNFATIKMDRSDQAVLVAGDVEYDEPPDPIG